MLLKATSDFSSVGKRIKLKNDSAIEGGNKLALFKCKCKL